MARRHELISDLIRGQAVGSQAELSELLAERGIRVTQSCISRDLSLLGAVKRGRAYTVAYADISEDDRRVLGAYARGAVTRGAAPCHRAYGHRGCSAHRAVSGPLRLAAGPGHRGGGRHDIRSHPESGRTARPVGAVAP